MGKGSIWPTLAFILLIVTFTLPFLFASTGAGTVEGACISFVVLFFLLAIAVLKSRVPKTTLSMYEEDEDHRDEDLELDDEYEAYPEGDGFESVPDLEYRDFNLQSTYQFLVDNNLVNEMLKIKESKDNYGSYTTSLKRAKIIDLLDSYDLLTDFIYEVWPMGDTEKGKKRIEFFQNLYLRFNSEEVKHDMVESEPLEMDKDIQILRGIESIRGFVRAKIAIVNKQKTTITDASLKIIYDRDSLHLDHIEPDLLRHGDDIVMGNIQPGQKKTVAVYLDPHICTSSRLKGVLHYHDTLGELKTEILRPKEIDVVCPIFFTREEANPAMLRNLVENKLDCQDNKVYKIPAGMRLEKVFYTVRTVMAGHDIKFVRHVIDKHPFQAEAWYYGVTKVKKHQLVMRIAVLKDKEAIEIYTAANEHSELTGLLAELGHDLEKRFQEQGCPVQQITNITIKDSIFNRSTLLFSELDGNIEVRDSVVSRSTIGGGEPVTKSNDEARPPAGVGDGGAGYDPKVEKKRIKAEVKKMKKPGFSASRTGNIFWIDELNIVCLQLYLYNKSFNKGKGRPHIPLDKTVEEIRQLLGKTEGAIKMQVKGFSNWDPKWVGKPTKAREASRPRVWNEWHDSDPYVLTAEANKNLELYERGEL